MPIRVQTLSPEQLDEYADTFESLVEAEMRRVMRGIAGELGQVVVAAQFPWAVSLDDLNPIRSRWLTSVVDRLLDALFDMVFEVSTGTTERISEALGGAYIPPVTREVIVSSYAENATNRLALIGDELWENAKTELLAGMEAGESIPQYSARVMNALDVSLPRARTIARTEVIGNLNRAAMTAARSTGYDMIKEWMSTEDERTRPNHATADGQTVPENEPFTVGGFPLDHPGDPAGPPQEVINCRCSTGLIFADDVAEAVEEGDPLTSSVNKQTGYSVKLPKTSIYGASVWSMRFDPSGDEKRPWAVIADGKTSERFASSSAAATRLRVLEMEYPNGDDNDNDCPPGHHRMPDGECMPDADMASDVHGVATLEGIWTGDGRQFSLDSLTWPDPAERSIPLQWQKETSHGGDNDVTVNVGWLTGIQRSGNSILVTGKLDAESSDGKEALRFLAKRGRFGVSIVADDPEQADFEVIYKEGCESILNDPEASEESFQNCFTPKGVIYHSGRIRALTLVDVPAFVDAYIELTNPGEVVASGTATFGAVAPHDTATVDASWDNDAQESRLESPMSLDTARNMYAWIDTDQAEDDMVTKSACRFPHHEVNADGTPGAANLTACSAGIGALNGARGGTTIPREDMQGVYDHLATHLRDADREPPPPTFSTIDALEPLVAASHIISIPDTPPAEWFNEPAELPQVGAITVTDDGQIYGLLAPADIAHRSFKERVTVPTGVDYSRWMNRQTITSDGSRITTGPLTMDCGHAAVDGRTNASAAIDHYDNSCSVVATVRIGENRHGTWISGALLPDITPYQIARMLACQLSGDWRPHREKAGKREFCGALFVPVPGFPVAATASARVAQGELVAASAPVHWAGANNFEVMHMDETTTDTAPEAMETAPSGTEETPATDETESTTGEDSASAETETATAETSEELPEFESSVTDEPSESSDDLPSWEEMVAKQEREAEINRIAEEIGV